MTLSRIHIRSLLIGLLTGIGLVAGLRAVAQPAPPPAPAANPMTPRYQIASTGSDTKMFVLDNQTNTVFVLTATSPEVWEATPGFAVPEAIHLLELRKGAR